MHPRLLLWAAGLAAGLLLTAAVSPAQTLDPTFTSPALYEPAYVTAVAVQPDGKRLVAGAAVEAEGQAANLLVRYNADGTLDQGFRAAVSGYLWNPGQVLLPLRNGKLLVSVGIFRAGAVVRSALVRLNADGSVDAAFDAGGQLNNTQYLAVSEQPDGKLVVSGTFTQFGSMAAPGLVRLLPDGAPDPGFTPPSFGLPNVRIMTHALQPDGKLLIGGFLNSTSAATLLRLNTDGSTDPSFTPPAMGTLWALALQPDGKVLVSSSSQLRRLLPTGAADNTFTPLNQISPLQRLLVQPDGSILAATNFASSQPTSTGSLVRIQANGTRDASFQLPASWAAGQGFGVTALARQADGRLLVGTSRPVYPTGHARDARTLLLLEPSSSLSSSWQPLPLARATTFDVTSQPDGSVLAAGSFTRCGSWPVGGIVRLRSDGQPDTAFNRRAAVNGTVRQVKLLPSGQVLVGGEFTQVGATATQALVRLLPNGELDPAFAYRPSTYTISQVQKLGVLGNGSVLVHGTLRPAGSSGPPIPPLLRLLPNGQHDPTYAYTRTDYLTAVHFLADGRTVLVAQDNTGAGANVQRLLPSGADDASFAAFGMGSAYVDAVLVDSQDRVLLVEATIPSGTSPRTYQVLRYTANNNAPDATFTPVTLNNLYDYVIGLVEQPNHRILLVGGFVGTNNEYQPLRRLLPDGQPDPSFASTAVSGEGYAVAVQPDGKLLLGGYYFETSSQQLPSVVRLTAPNVLSVSPQQRLAATSVWPVPARQQLHLALDAAARPQRVSLLDAAGRVVLQQSAARPELSLDVRALPAGVYLLRVDYADGPATRRVVVE
jgi:uncharacterized delta-60 repeat protein